MGRHQPPPDREGSASTPSSRLAVLASFTGDGGVENMLTNLLRGFVAAGVSVDLILLKARGGHLERIPPQVNIIRLDVSTSALALPAVVRYLRRQRPAAMLVAKDRASRIALLARRIAGVQTRLVLRMGMHLSGSLAGKGVIRRWSRYLPVRWLYPWADRIIAVSQPVADDLAAIGRIPPDRFVVIKNPSVPDNIAELARAPVDHPWLGPNATMPVIMGVWAPNRSEGFRLAGPRIRRGTSTAPGATDHPGRRSPARHPREARRNITNRGLHPLRRVSEQPVRLALAGLPVRAVLPLRGLPQRTRGGHGAGRPRRLHQLPQRAGRDPRRRPHRPPGSPRRRPQALVRRHADGPSSSPADCRALQTCRLRATPLTPAPREYLRVLGYPLEGDCPRHQ